MTNMTNKEAIKWLNALLASDKIKPILRTGETCAIKTAIEVLQQPSLSSIIDETAYNYRRNLPGYSNSDEVEESFKAGAGAERVGTGIAKYRPPTDSKETIQRIAAELLALARKELEPEVLERLEEAYKNQDDVVYENGKRDGKAEALKDLPRWKKTTNRGTYVDASNLLFHDGYYLGVKDLEKLPGFKEDESHE